uniref:RING-type domain-containing protein n=1 Tax=Panagrellus redivivus TaxID=6233 RepID=A0A7E4V604_PANRE
MDTEVMCIHCLASISDSQMKTELLCGHRFHFACQFEHRMNTGSNSCLVCINDENSNRTPLSTLRQRMDTQPPPLPTTQPPSIPLQREVPNASNNQHPPPIPPRNNLNNKAPRNNTPQRQSSQPPVRPNSQARSTVSNGTTLQQQRPFLQQQEKPNQSPQYNGPRNTGPINNNLQPQPIRANNLPGNYVPNTPQPPFFRQVRPSFPHPIQNPGYPVSTNMIPQRFPPPFIGGAPNEPLRFVLVASNGAAITLTSLPMQPTPQSRQTPGQGPKGRSKSVAPARPQKTCFDRANCKNPSCPLKHPVEKCLFDTKCNNNNCERWHPLRNRQRR